MKMGIAHQRSTISKPSGLLPVSKSLSRRAASLKPLHPNRPISLTIRSQTILTKEKNPNQPVTKPSGPVRLIVGLPLDSVSDCNKPNHTRAITAGLKALNLLGIHGVDLPVHRSKLEPAVDDWSAYLSLARIVGDAGLPLRISLDLSSLPPETNQDLLFSDRHGTRSKSTSFAVDTPMDASRSFLSTFLDAFQEHIGTTITDISIGELRYPGSGFQCYDKYMLARLKKRAEETGNPNWGLSGPHDESSGFFDNRGSWESPYGDFFLSWYSSELLEHGDRVMSLASNVFGHLPVAVSAKVPLLGSRAARLTAGYYGYDSVAEMFARNSCQMIVSGIDQDDEDNELSRITKACEKHGVKMNGESLQMNGNGFERVKERLSVLDSYTYQRMGAEFFSPEHWPKFVGFVRSMTEPEMETDDLLSKEETVTMSVGTLANKDREMQEV